MPNNPDLSLGNGGSTVDPTHGLSPSDFKPPCPSGLTTVSDGCLPDGIYYPVQTPFGTASVQSVTPVPSSCSAERTARDAAIGVQFVAQNNFNAAAAAEQALIDHIKAAQATISKDEADVKAAQKKADAATNAYNAAKGLYNAKQSSFGNVSSASEQAQLFAAMQQASQDVKNAMFAKSATDNALTKELAEINTLLPQFEKLSAATNDALTKLQNANAALAKAQAALDACLANSGKK